MSGRDYLNSALRREIEQAILARLESKSDHNYQWPRWAAADEASHAVMEFLDSIENPEPKHEARKPHPATMAGRS